MKKYIILPFLCLLALSCKKEGITVATELGCDCINRYYYEPFIVGTQMEFAFAMYMPKGSGRLNSAEVICSIPGAEGTSLENYAYSTDDYGQDLPHRIGDRCVVDGNKYTVSFDVDTVATTLRFHYVVPEEARGRKVDFNFAVSDSNGKKAEYDITDCEIREMEMKLDIPLTPERCFFSLEELNSYTKAEAEEKNVQIDFLWGYSGLFSDKGDRSFIGNPARVADYGQFFTAPIPRTAVDTPKMMRYNILDHQLARQEFSGFYIDDRDFRTLNINCSTSIIIGLQNRTGFWVESADGKYRAYVYCNSYSAEGCVLSVKRYTVK